MDNDTLIERLILLAGMAQLHECHAQLVKPGAIKIYTRGLGKHGDLFEASYLITLLSIEVCVHPETVFDNIFGRLSAELKEKMDA